MTVYVDTIKKTFPINEWRWNTHCHMAGDNEKELHQMAEDIGLSIYFCHYEEFMVHYDLTKSLREKAIKLGAIEVSCREMIRKVRGEI